MPSQSKTSSTSFFGASLTFKMNYESMHSRRGSGTCSDLRRRGNRLARGEALFEHRQDPGPAFLVLMSHLVVRNARVAQSDLGLFSTRHESDGHHGFDALGRFRHPGVLDFVRAFDVDEAPLVWPGSSFVFHCKIEKTVH